MIKETIKRNKYARRALNTLKAITVLITIAGVVAVVNPTKSLKNIALQILNRSSEVAQAETCVPPTLAEYIQMKANDTKELESFKNYIDEEALAITRNAMINLLETTVTE